MYPKKDVCGFPSRVSTQGGHQEPPVLRQALLVCESAQAAGCASLSTCSCATLADVSLRLGLQRNFKGACRTKGMRTHSAFSADKAWVTLHPVFARRFGSQKLSSKRRQRISGTSSATAPCYAGRHRSPSPSISLLYKSFAPDPVVVE